MILVTGATGKIAQQLLPQLLATGQKIRAITRAASKLDRFQPALDVIEGDLFDKVVLKRAVKDVEKIFLLTTGFHEAAPAQSLVLEAAKQAGVRHIIKLSTLQAGILPRKGSGETHARMEEEIQASGLDYTFLRPTVFNTNTIWWFARQIKQGDTVRFTSGTGRISPVDPYDIASVATAALTQPGHAGKVYTLTGPELLTFPKMVQTIGIVIGKPRRYEELPLEAITASFARMGIPETALKEIGEIMEGIATNRFALVSPDIERVTGRPARSFGEWVTNTKEAFQ